MKLAPRWRRRLWFVGLALLAWLLAVWWWSALRAHLGSPAARLAEDWHESHRILDRNGALLRDLPTQQGRRGRPATLEEIGPRLVTATVEAEDADFFEHDGLDRTAIMRAAATNVARGRIVSGASTITQQLVKLLDTRGVPGARTLGVKVREAARAQNLEAELSKAAILQAYLNRLPYGHGLVGPQAAARGYFGVAPHRLSWAQAAFLAVVPRAPARFDPLDHTERVVRHQRALLHRMHEHGHLDDAGLRRALAEPVTPRSLVRAFEAPHFVETLRLEDRLADAPQTRTTLDLSLQHDVEGLLATHMAAMTEYEAHDAAAIVVDNATGDILAWVGSADFFSEAIAGQVDMVRARRQPGSTLKPFVYALAFARGHTGPQMVPDVPTTFREGRGQAWVPRNFHGDFLGPVPARLALAASLNVPPVRLLSELGTGQLLTLLHSLGMRSLDEDAEHYGLALALGSGEITMRELAGAYAALARGGLALPLRYRLDDAQPAAREVIAPEVAALVTDALSDPLARARLLPGRSPFSIGFPVAIKTGTSTGYRDAWTAGYTSERTVVAWVGNADGRPMKGVTGATGAGGLFADVMRRAMRDVGTRRPLVPPDTLETAAVCPLSGLRPGSACPHGVARRFMPGTAPETSCGVHAHAHVDGERVTCDADADETVVLLPEAYDDWLARFEFGAPGKDPDGRPWLAATTVPGCGAEALGPPVLAIVEPATGDAVHVDGPRDVVEIVAAVRRDPAGRVTGPIEIVVDDEVVATVDAPPWSALVTLPRGQHEAIARPKSPHVAAVIEGSAFAVR